LDLALYARKLGPRKLRLYSHRDFSCDVGLNIEKVIGSPVKALTQNTTIRVDIR
jgi:hypothetical protein